MSEIFDFEQVKNDVFRIADVEDYVDESDCLDDAGILLEHALSLICELTDTTAALGQKQTVIDDMLESLDEAKFTEPELRSKLDKQRQRIERLQNWVNDLQAGMYINCVYCGHRYGPDDEVPATMADVLKEHISKCPEHPMSAQTQRIEQLEEALLEAATRLENCIRTNGTTPDFAAQAVARYRQLTAGDSAKTPLAVPVNDGEWYECSECGDELLNITGSEENGTRLECGRCGHQWWEYEYIAPETDGDKSDD